MAPAGGTYHDLPRVKPNDSNPTIHIKQKAKDMNEISHELFEKILKQQDLYSKISRLKEEEALLRREIALKLLEGLPFGAHTFNYDLAKVKIVRSASYSLDQRAAAEMIANGDFSDEELECIKTEYSLKMRQFNKLEFPSGLNNIITVKDSMPTIEVKFK